ncbi:MAG: hypothetical protein QOJ98_217 [Acidobacteriota bacterium]|jgi:hypothetical protein|nr:hypothetical protein [Acidobacteriota bacterium]
MASEAAIKRVLDLLTIAPQKRIETLGLEAVDHTRSMRKIVGTKNVVAVGISEKVHKGQPTGKLSLTFYVEKKISLNQLKASMAIPPTVPEALSGEEAIPTDVVVIGKLVPEATANVTRHPVQPGNSIGHVKSTAGTLGAIVTKGTELHLLSNSHVLALSGTAKKGDAITFPGPFDGGKMPEDLVARLSGFQKFVTGGDFVNRADCAIAKPTASRLADVVSEIKGLVVPKGTVKPVRGMKVIKVGRTTGKTRGEIRDVNFRFTLSYEGVGDVGFIDQVLCTRYTEPGDSGSLVLEEATGRAVGLHFAGANGGSVFNPIGEVLKALDVKLVTKAIGKPQAKPAKKATTKKAAAKKAAPSKKTATSKKTSAKK